jgi:hypothetical protein
MNFLEIMKDLTPDSMSTLRVVAGKQQMGSEDD